MISPYVEEAAKRAAAIGLTGKHTPGPWHVNGIHVGDAEGTIIGYVGRHGGAENEANARLFAAAPDLLAACQALLDAGPLKYSGKRCMDARAMAEAAIAKATPG